MIFTRDDSTMFRNLNTLGQKAGVPRDKLPRLVVKELVDNSLDASGNTEFGPIESEDGHNTDPKNGFFVQDAGGGIAGTDDEVAALFSTGRQLTSSKLLRLPTRGTLGNGLRVVSGAVLASGGSLVVSTRGRSLTLYPQDDGTTKITNTVDWVGSGTRIEVRLGPALSKVEDNIFVWAHTAKHLAAQGTCYRGKSSAHWYDGDAFFELLNAAPSEVTVRQIVAELEGCAGPKAGCCPRVALQDQPIILV